MTTPTIQSDAQALESLLAFAPMGLAFFDRQLQFTRVNEYLAHHNNLAAEEHIGRRLEEILIGKCERLAERILSVFESKRPIPVFEQVMTTHAESGEQTFSISVFPVFGPDGEVTESGAAFFLHEDDSLEENILTPHELKFRHLAETLPQIVWTASPDGKVEYISPQWTQLRGLNPEHEGDMVFEPFIHEEDVEEAMIAWKKAIATGEIYDHTYRLKHQDGRYLYHTVRAVPVLDQHGNISQWYGNSTNVENHKRTEFSLQEATRSKDMFIAILGHELRNPLAAISTHYEVLKHPDLDNTRRDKAFAQLGEQIKHLSKLVDDTLDISRLTSGKLRVDKSTTELNQLVEIAVEGYALRAVENHVKINLKCHESPLWINADSVRLSQCVANLISNAIKFTDQGGDITVSVLSASSGTRALIRVQDSGIGMKPEEIATLFEPFTQSEHAKGRSKDGLGLGLAVVTKLVALHEGKIDAHSDGLDTGTTVTIDLPTIDPPQNKSITDQNHLDEQTSPSTILVIDDDESVACSLQFFFELEGHQVHVAHNASQAFELLEDVDPAIIFCDLTLPGTEDGWQFARRLRSERGDSNMPYIVALSGRTQQQYVEKSTAAGFDEHLAKPPIPGALRKCILTAQSGS